MAITVTHQKVSAIADGGDSGLVRPSDWNANHSLSGTVPVANGGTDAATASAACKNLGTWNILAASAVAVSHTGDTNETTLATIQVPAGAMGANGFLRITTVVSKTGTAGTLLVRRNFGATNYGAGGSMAASNISHMGQTLIANRNSQSSQIGGTNLAATWNNAGGWGQSTGSVTTSTEDTSAAVNITITVTLGNAADTAVLESYIVEIFAQA